MKRDKLVRNIWLISVAIFFFLILAWNLFFRKGSNSLPRWLSVLYLGSIIVGTISFLLWLPTLIRKLFVFLKSKSKLWKILKVLVISLSILFMSFIFLSIFVIKPSHMEGDLMSPTIRNGEYFLENRLAYRYSNPGVGDVVVYKDSAEDEEYIARYIARVVAVPGDSVSISKNNIKVNEQVVDSFSKLSARFNPGDLNFILGSDEYFLLTDAKLNQDSSKLWFPAKRHDFISKIWFIYWQPCNARLVR